MNTVKHMKYGLSLVLGFLTQGGALAAQHLQVDDGRSYSIKVSANELTRISVERGRLEKAWALNTNWDVKPDKDAGEIYIRPKDGQKKAFSFFVRDNYGNTYTLVAMPYDIPSETIVLEPTRRVSKVKSSELQNQSYVQQIKGLIKDMANGVEDNYLVTVRGDAIPLWKETKITLSRQYEVNDLIGEIYRIENASGKPLVLDEQEFVGFGDRVKAVSLEANVLQANEATRLYVVRAQP